MCQNNSTRCQVILGMQWIPVSPRQPFLSMFTDTFSESLPTSCIRSNWKPWNVNSWIPQQRRPGHAGKVRESTCTGILTSTCVRYTRRPFDVWRGDGFAPALHRIPTIPHIAGGNPIFTERLGGSDICMRKSAGPKHGVVWEIGCRDVIRIYLL